MRDETVNVNVAWVDANAINWLNDWVRELHVYLMHACMDGGREASIANLILLMYIYASNLLYIILIKRWTNYIRM